MFLADKILRGKMSFQNFFSLFNFNDHSIQHLILIFFFFSLQLIRILNINELLGLNFLRLGNQFIMLFAELVNILQILRNFLPFLVILEFQITAALDVIFSERNLIRRGTFLMFSMGNKVKILEILGIFALNFFMMCMQIMMFH